jgi:DNA repair exonuclease SbcCD nuclease subunit
LPIRILVLADTHLGFDLPVRPRLERRRRGHDFFANFELILHAAVSDKVDCVVHGGDLFYRSRVPAELVQQAFLPIKRVASAGIPFFLVPGNHERSRIPYDMLALHEGIHIFDRPRSFVLESNGTTLAFAGFPYCREGVRSRFLELLEATRWRENQAEINLLCAHHCFEGATVGAHNFTFRHGQDVVRVHEVPEQFSAVITGHVHRAQVLQEDLQGRPLPSPIIYPGSIERTSFAEREEEKGYFLLNIRRGSHPTELTADWEFRRLPTRPMMVEEISVESLAGDELERGLIDLLHKIPSDAVVQIRARGKLRKDARPILSAAHLRGLAPSTMNVEIVMVDERNRSPRL